MRFVAFKPDATLYQPTGDVVGLDGSRHSLQALAIWSIAEIEARTGLTVAERETPGGTYSAWPSVPEGEVVDTRGATLDNGTVILAQTTKPIPSDAELAVELDAYEAELKLSFDEVMRDRLAVKVVERTGLTKEEADAKLDGIKPKGAEVGEIILP